MDDTRTRPGDPCPVRARDGAPRPRFTSSTWCPCAPCFPWRLLNRSFSTPPLPPMSHPSATGALPDRTGAVEPVQWKTQSHKGRVHPVLVRIGLPDVHTSAVRLHAQDSRDSGDPKVCVTYLLGPFLCRTRHERPWTGTRSMRTPSHRPDRPPDLGCRRGGNDKRAGPSFGPTFWGLPIPLLVSN